MLAASALTLPLSRRVVYARTGDFAFTLRANLTTRWLRRVPVRRGVVRFFGLPKVQTPVSSILTITKSWVLYQHMVTKLKYLYLFSPIIDYLYCLCYYIFHEFIRQV